MFRVTDESSRARSPSENCFLKGASAIEDRIVETVSQSSSHEARGNACREASPDSPHLYKRPFLLSSISVHSKADVTSECCVSGRSWPTLLAPSPDHAREIA